MNGFDNYQPTHWLDGIFVINPKLPHVQHREKRRGIWSSLKGNMTKAAFSAAFVAAAPSLMAAPGRAVSDLHFEQRLSRDVARRAASELAPAGYHKALGEAIAKAPKLTEHDLPEGEFLF